MWFEDHFGSGSQRNERVKLAAAEPRSDHSDDEPATIGRQANDDLPRMMQMSMA